MLGQQIYDASNALHNWYRRCHNYVDATAKQRVEFWQLVRRLNEVTTNAIATFEDRS